MHNLNLKTNPDVETVFDRYPNSIRDKVANLRRMILEAANDIEMVNELEETLKWGEPSYLTKYGSTIRIDWKEKTPEQYAIYFKCTSKLVPTFQALYGNLFQFEGTRAIVFKLDDDIPEKELKKCISAALVYHKVKQEPQLGII